MEAESEIKPGNRKGTPKGLWNREGEAPGLPLSLSLFLLLVLSSLPAWSYYSNPTTHPTSHADLDQKGGAGEAEISFPPWSYSFLGHISCISSLRLSSESESPYPAGLSPALSGSSNLGGETEVKKGLWVSESPKLNSNASTLPFQALLTQFIKQKCEPPCPPLCLCEMG